MEGGGVWGRGRGGGAWTLVCVLPMASESDLISYITRTQYKTARQKFVIQLRTYFKLRQHAEITEPAKITSFTSTLTKAFRKLSMTSSHLQRHDDDGVEAAEHNDDLEGSSDPAAPQEEGPHTLEDEGTQDGDQHGRHEVVDGHGTQAQHHRHTHETCGVEARRSQRRISTGTGIVVHLFASPILQSLTHWYSSPTTDLHIGTPVLPLTYTSVLQSYH